jgi:hypothetical protein
MKLNRKGFMLAEVVIVSVVVATVLVTLYTGLKNVSSAYETRNRYYDVDSLYAAMDINDIMIGNISKYSEYIYSDIAIELNDENYILEYQQLYEKTDYSINFYLTPFNNEKMLTLKDLNDNVTFDEYIDYLNDNIIFEEDYDYIIIVERVNVNDKDDCYYYALKLKY